MISENNRFAEHSSLNELMATMIEWNENGSLNTNLNYLHLEAAFAENDGAQFFDIYTKRFKQTPANLLSFAKYAPQTNEGHQTLIKLMAQFANIGDYESCTVLFEWICEDRAAQIVPIDHYNLLLRALHKNKNKEANKDALAWNIWCDIKKNPIAFDEKTIFYLLSTLKIKKRHFVDDLLKNYDCVVSTDAEMLSHILPHIKDLNSAYKRYRSSVHLNGRCLSVSMLKNIANNLDAFKGDWSALREYISELTRNYLAADTKTIKQSEIERIASTMTQICSLPNDKKQKYKLGDAHNVISVFLSLIDGKCDDKHFVHYLLDNASNFEQIAKICREYGDCDAFGVDNLLNLVQRVKHSKEINHEFVSFVTNKIEKKIDTMTFDEARVALNTLSILNKQIVNNNAQQFVSLIECIQHRLIALFDELQCANDGRVIVFNLDEIIGMLSMFTKYRIYCHRLINGHLAEQIVSNIQLNNPQHAHSILFFDEATRERKQSKNIKALFPIYTSILRHMRYLNCYNRKLFSLIASSLQKRPDIIRMDELREWCLAFGVLQHTSNSIWLSIQSVLCDNETNQMPLDWLIDVVWSMSVNELIPNQWLIPDLIALLNENCSVLDELSFIHKARLFEIFQALYASSICHKSLNLINQDVIDTLHSFYGEYVCSQFQQQCKLRPAVHKFGKFLSDKQVHFEIGGSVGNMFALCDIVLPQIKVVIEVFDHPHVTKRSQQRTREWIKFRARREMTRRLIQNAESKWHFVLVDGADPDYDMDAFSRLIHKFLFAERLKNQIDAPKHRQIPQHMRLSLT